MSDENCEHKWEIITPSFEVCTSCKLGRFWNEQEGKWEYRQGRKVEEAKDE
jgi:hypothetical protein